jgi:hypothetical protein
MSRRKLLPAMDGRITSDCIQGISLLGNSSNKSDRLISRAWALDMMYEHHSDVHQSPAYGPLGTTDPIGLMPVGVQKETLSRYLPADPESGSQLRLEVIQSPRDGCSMQTTCVQTALLSQLTACRYYVTA